MYIIYNFYYTRDLCVSWWIEYEVYRRVYKSICKSYDLNISSFIRKYVFHFILKTIFVMDEIIFYLFERKWFLYGEEYECMRNMYNTLIQQWPIHLKTPGFLYGKEYECMRNMYNTTLTNTPENTFYHNY